MSGQNFYDVTKWHIGNPYEDIGEVINSMIADIKCRQNDADVNDGGKPGAVIFIPSGDYHLRTQVVIDISYLKIMGTGHGFVSSSIRFNTPQEEWKNLHELWPGGSRILVDLIPDAVDERSGAAFYVKREGEPRISSVEFSNFCIDGLHFVEDSCAAEPENTYVNGKTGIFVDCAHDSFRISEMGIIYVEHGVVCCHADALAIHDNFIAECGSCIELRCDGQAAKITDNLLGAGFQGYSIFAENFGGLLVGVNNVFPRGSSSLHFSGVVRSTVSGNRFHSFYPGMLILDKNCTENLVASNHFLRDHEPWPPMMAYDNGLNDDFGLLKIHGSNNSIIGNHISETIGKQYLKPLGVKPVIIYIEAGYGNYVANNHIVATSALDAAAAADTQDDNEEDSCFGAQVGALLSTDSLEELEVVAVQVAPGAVKNVILDTGRDEQCELDRTKNTFRALP